MSSAAAVVPGTPLSVISLSGPNWKLAPATAVNTAFEARICPAPAADINRDVMITARPTASSPAAV
jgi:hypothetical protein